MRWADPVLDLAGLLLRLGLLAATGRRSLFSPQCWLSVRADGVLPILFRLIVLSGLLMEGARLVGAEAALARCWNRADHHHGISVPKLAYTAN